MEVHTKNYIIIISRFYWKLFKNTSDDFTNKCTTILQISEMSNDVNNADKVYQVKYVKCRNTKRYAPFQVCFCEESNELVIANSEMIDKAKQTRLVAAPIKDVIVLLQTKLATAPCIGSDLIQILQDEFKASDKTIKERLKEIEDKKMAIMVNDEMMYIKSSKEGRSVYYNLIAKKLINEPRQIFL